MKLKTILGLAAMATFGSLLLFSFGEQVGGYMNFAQAEASGNKAHVVGTWANDQPMHYDRSDNIFTFHMRDEQGTVRRVRYTNPKPANFEEAEQLVVEGYARDDVFVAEHILVKCPSKYNDAKGLDGAQAARTQ
jgi:cytochrome c-type biogenesis protein CcmE